jgi:hypothetical protein
MITSTDLESIAKVVGVLLLTAHVAAFISMIPGIVLSGLFPHPWTFGIVFLATWAGCFWYVDQGYLMKKRVES